ncbi:MAG: response regulator transcription factor [Solirubrobacterales bacterium]|nr:response regulator transcription factor [Solirubrobacterales bacterium]
MNGEARRDGLRILIVDDHEVVHFGFRLMLDRQMNVERCLAAKSEAEAIAMCTRYEPHVALVDLFVGEQFGPEIAKSLGSLSPAPRILLISGAGSISRSAAGAAGALGFVGKNRSASDIALAIETVHQGKEFFDIQETAPTTLLSEREREILALIATGATNKEIGDRLHLSRYTVQDYARAVFRKLDVPNRTAAVQRAQRLGLLD